MRPYFFILCLVLISCGGKKSKLQFKETSVTDLIARKGQPVEEKPIPVEQGKMLLYPDGESYQAENDTVTTRFRNPVGDETLLLYWKHKFKDCETSTSEVNKKRSHHERMEYTLVCDQEKIGVVYSEGSGLVSRIVEYEK